MKRFISLLNIVLVFSLIAAGCGPNRGKYSELKPNTDPGDPVDISAASRGGLGSKMRANVRGNVYEKGTKKGLKGRKLHLALLRVERDAKGKTTIVQVYECEVKTEKGGAFEATLKDDKKASGGGDYRVRIVDEDTTWIVISVSVDNVTRKNLEAALKFLRNHRNKRIADGLEALLEDGMIQVDPSRHDPETAALSNIIYLPTLKVDVGVGEWDERSHFNNVVQLAETLVHEYTHYHQLRLARALCKLRESRGRSNWCEIAAWGITLGHVKRWLEQEKAEYDEYHDKNTTNNLTTVKEKIRRVERIKELNYQLEMLLDGFLGHKCYGASDVEFVKKWKKDVESHGKKLQTLWKELRREQRREEELLKAWRDLQELGKTLEQAANEALDALEKAVYPLDKSAEELFRDTLAPMLDVLPSVLLEESMRLEMQLVFTGVAFPPVTVPMCLKYVDGMLEDIYEGTCDETDWSAEVEIEMEIREDIVSEVLGAGSQRVILRDKIRKREIIIKPDNVVDKILRYEGIPTRTPAPEEVVSEAVSPPTDTPTPTSTPTITPTPTPEEVQPQCVPDAAFVADVTVPDGTLVSRGECVNKIWRLSNSGECTWENYQLAFVSGDQMGAPDAQTVSLTMPGDTADISVTICAPEAPGTYTSGWRMRDDSGQVFGSEVYVQIMVTDPALAKEYVEEAIAFFEQGKSALEMHDQTGEGDCEKAIKNLKTAIEKCTTALKFNPNDPYAYYYLGRSRFALGEGLNEGVKEIEHALDIGLGDDKRDEAKKVIAEVREILETPINVHIDPIMFAKDWKKREPIEPAPFSGCVTRVEARWTQSDANDEKYLVIWKSGGEAACQHSNVAKRGDTWGGSNWSEDAGGCMPLGTHCVEVRIGDTKLAEDCFEIK